MSERTYTLKAPAIYWPRHQRGDMATCRDLAASYLRRLREDGFPIAVLSPGREWEILEPDDALMRPDTCGIMAIVEDPALRACDNCGCEFQGDGNFCSPCCAASYWGNSCGCDDCRAFQTDLRRRRASGAGITFYVTLHS